MLIRRFRQFGGVRLLRGYARWGVLGLIMRESIKCLLHGRSIRMVYPKVVSFFEPIFRSRYYKPLPDTSVLQHESSKRIWFCWIQGMDQAPEMVRVCLQQLVRWFPEYDITVITKENYKEWISIPEYIEKKWLDTQIPAVLFSDILRLELLIKHGGTWIDASVLCTGWENGSRNDEMIHNVMQADLFMYRYATPKTNVYNGISNWFISAKTNNAALIACRDMLYAYWKENDCVLVYHMFHIFFDMLVKDNPEIILQMPVGYSMPSLRLGDHLNENFNSDIWQKFTEKICIHKLNYRKAPEAMRNPNSYYNNLFGSNGKLNTDNRVDSTRGVNYGAESLFFELLQVAVGNRERLSVKPTDEQWNEIRETAKKHAVNGIVYAGMERLPEEQWPERYFRLRWGGQIQKTIDRNELLNKRCDEVVRRFRNAGFWCCILKGQGNLFNYPQWLKDKRTPGDIDVWVRPYKYKNRPIRKVVDYCQHIRKAEKVGYIHLDFNVWKDVEMEVHIRPSFLCSPLRNHRLQSYCKKQQPMVARMDTPYPVPSNEFNAVFQLLHIYKHLYEEGIGLRQLIDYYFVLQNLDTAESRDNVMIILKSLAVDKFAGAVMYVLQRTLLGTSNVIAEKTEMPCWMICQPDLKRGQHLLKEIMLAGNFGKYDERIGDLSHESHNDRFKRKNKRAFRLIALYPHEAIWQPYFMIYHSLWRGCKLWRWE